MKIAICAMVRDEAATLPEWLAHHLAIGFDSAIVIDHGSTDGMAEVVKKVARTRPVKAFPWPFNGPTAQVDAYLFAAKAHADEFDWIAFLDADEFVMFPHGTNSLRELLCRSADADAVAFNWLMFGSSGRETAAPSILGGYLKRAPAAFGPNAHVKTIVRPSALHYFENPHFAKVSGQYWSADGEPVRWVRSGLAADYQKPALVRINHYFTRSRQCWQRRLTRGQAGSRVRTWKDFEDYDRNEVTDLTALPHAAQACIAVQNMGLRLPATDLVPNRAKS